MFTEIGLISEIVESGFMVKQGLESHSPNRFFNFIMVVSKHTAFSEIYTGPDENFEF